MSTSIPITLPHSRNSTGVSFECLSGSAPMERRMTRTSIANWTLRLQAPISITSGAGGCWIVFAFSPVPSEIPFLGILLSFYFCPYLLLLSFIVLVLLAEMRRKLVVAILWWTPCYEWAMKERYFLWTASRLRLTWLSVSGH